MSGIPLRVGVSRYDHTRALFDGSVAIEGADATFESAPIVSDLFERMIRDRVFDVSEMGLTYYIRTLDLPDPPFIALPVFPARHFRHSAIFVNASKGIVRPEDLRGRTIGEFALYGHDAGVWAKGILADEYGLTPDACRWVIGGTDKPLPPFDYVPDIRPSGVAVTRAPEGKALGPMLEAGEIDALISALVPAGFLEGSPNVARLFPYYEAVERDHYRRTSIFPIMHALVVRRDLLAEHPGLAAAIYGAFLAAKEAAMEAYRKDRVEQHIVTMIPWFGPLFEANRATFPEDWWPYGLQSSRAVIDMFLRHHHEQGLSRRFTPEEIFAPDLLDT